MLKVEFGKIVHKIEVELPLKQVAEVVKQGVENNLKGQKTYEGTPATPLEPITLRIKESLGQPLRIFEATGKLLRSVFRKKLNENEWLISIAPERFDVMAKLQIEGVGRKRTKRPAVGVSKETLQLVVDLLSRTKVKPITKNV